MLDCCHSWTLQCSSASLAFPLKASTDVCSLPFLPVPSNKHRSGPAGFAVTLMLQIRQSPAVACTSLPSHQRQCDSLFRKIMWAFSQTSLPFPALEKHQYPNIFLPIKSLSLWQTNGVGTEGHQLLMETVTLPTKITFSSRRSVCWSGLATSRFLS